MAVLTSLRYERTRVRQAKTGQRVRLVATITTQLGGVFNLTHASMPYGRTSERSGSPYFAWSNLAVPLPFEHDTIVAGAEACTEPRFCWTPARNLLIVCNNAGVIEERRSDSDGYDWNAPTTIFTAASHPDISMDRAGLILRAAFISGRIKIRRQYPGDAAPAAELIVQDQTAAEIVVQDDSFRIVADRRNIWWMHVRIGALTRTSILWSADDGFSWDVTPGGLLGIASGSHPGLCVGVDGTLFAWSRVGTAVHLSRRAPGDTSWSTPAAIKDDVGANLSVIDQPCSMTEGYEGPRRLVLAAIITGETAVSEWTSADDGQTFSRLVGV